MARMASRFTIIKLILDLIVGWACHYDCQGLNLNCSHNTLFEIKSNQQILIKYMFGIK